MVTKNLLNTYLRDKLVPAGAATSLIPYSLLKFLENQKFIGAYIILTTWQK